MFEALHFPERLENPGRNARSEKRNILSRTEGLTILEIPLNFAKGGPECTFFVKLFVYEAHLEMRPYNYKKKSIT